MISVIYYNIIGEDSCLTQSELTKKDFKFQLVDIKKVKSHNDKYTCYIIQCHNL